MTDGKFDITIAPIMRLWGWDTQEQKVPDKQDIETFLPLVNYRNIEISTLNDEVRILPGMEIDMGGIAKGYIIEIARRFLESDNIQSGLINAGGDIAIIGKKNKNEKWKIGIQDPFTKGEHWNCYLLLEDTSIATSGDYERYFIEDDKVYSQIINPGTGLPENFNKSVSVICNSLEMADALATGFFSFHTDEIMKMVNNLDGVDAIIIDSENKYHISRNIIPDINFFIEDKNLKVIRYE
jgi:thiamine biosynthesis lipoprotein